MTGPTGRLLSGHREAVRFYRAHLAGTIEAQAYLVGRGLPGALPGGAERDRWNLGYAPPQWVGLVRHLRDHGYRDDEMELAGLAVRSRTGRLIDRFRDRIMVPLRCAGDGTAGTQGAAGDVVGFIGRDITDSPAVPKYLNSPTTPLYRKGTILFGFAEQRDLLAGGQVRRLIVEGPLDVIAVAEAQHGVPPDVVAVATCGTALTADHVDLLSTNGGLDRSLAVAFDPDRAGRAAADRAYGLLMHWPVAVDALELAADPADLLRDLGPAAARAALSATGRPLLDAVIDHKLQRWAAGIAAGWPEARVAALRAVAPLVASGQHPTEFTARVAHLALRLDLHPVVVNTAVLEVLQVPNPTAARQHPTRRGR